MRSRFCRVCRDFHPLESAWPEACLEHFGSRANDAPNIIVDTMAPTRNMADGKLYDSKRGFEKAVRAAGCEIVGNDTSVFNQPKRSDAAHQREIGLEIKNTIERLQSQ